MQVSMGAPAARTQSSQSNLKRSKNQTNLHALLCFALHGRPTPVNTTGHGPRPAARHRPKIQRVAEKSSRPIRAAAKNRNPLKRLGTCVMGLHAHVGASIRCRRPAAPAPAPRPSQRPARAHARTCLDFDKRGAPWRLVWESISKQSSSTHSGGFMPAGGCAFQGTRSLEVWCDSYVLLAGTQTF